MEKHLEADEESKHDKRVVHVGKIEDEDNDGNDDDNDNDNDYVAQDCCCICQEIVPLVQRGILEACDHHFHFSCILTWAKVTNLCPLCKKRFHSIKQVDQNGEEESVRHVENAKQVYRPDPQDHDIVAQLRLVNEIRCQQCGSGDHADVLLMCEERNCAVASHTFCLGLSQVPVGSWYCDQHSRTRASDFIPRRATTLSSRRRTRRLASLMSNVFQVTDQEAATTTGRATRRRQQPTRGIAASYALRMSRELEEIQQRADAMFARGDHLQFVQPSHTTIATLSRSTIVNSSRQGEIDRSWRDFERSRQLKGDGDVDEGKAEAVVAHRVADGVSRRFRAQYDELVNRMIHATSQDNYASTVSMMIPKTSRLGVVSSMKSFFQRLNASEKHEALQSDCLKHLWTFIKPIPTSTATSASVTTSTSSQDIWSSCLPQSQVIDATLTVLEMLPLAKAHLVENNELQTFIDRLAVHSSVNENLRRLAKKLRDKWNLLNPLKPPASDSSHAPRDYLDELLQNHQRSMESATQNSSENSAGRDLPAITSFSSRNGNQNQLQKRPRSVSSGATAAASADAEEKSKWKNAAVEYVKAKLYPTYKSSQRFSKDRFKILVKQVANAFLQEMHHMKSQVVLDREGHLTELSKTRLKVLIDKQYKASCHSWSASLLSASYSAMPTRSKKAKIVVPRFSG